MKRCDRSSAAVKIATKTFEDAPIVSTVFFATFFDNTQMRKKEWFDGKH